jgi:hypothetical protein
MGRIALHSNNAGSPSVLRLYVPFVFRNSIGPEANFHLYHLFAVSRFYFLCIRLAGQFNLEKSVERQRSIRALIEMTLGREPAWQLELRLLAGVMPRSILARHDLYVGFD